MRNGISDPLLCQQCPHIYSKTAVRLSRAEIKLCSKLPMFYFNVDYIRHTHMFRGYSSPSSPHLRNVVYLPAPRILHSEISEIAEIDTYN